MPSSSLRSSPELLLAESEPPKILPRILTRFDLISIYIAVIFGSYGAAQMAAQGWAGIPMMLLAAVTFLLPCILGAYELGTLFPSEGGIYVWARKTLGPVHGFIAGWLSWIPIFLLLPLDASVVITHLQYALGQTWGPSSQVIAQIVYIWLLLGICILRLRVSQTVVNIMFFVSLATAVFALLAGVLHGHPATPLDREIFSLDLHKYGFLYSAAVLWLLGVEVPFNMGAEFSDHKRTGKTMFLWGSILLLGAYLIGIVGILYTTPATNIDQTTGLVRAVATLSPTLGLMVTIATCLAVFAQATSTMNAYSRLLFVGAIEKCLPKKLARVSATGKTPWLAMLVQAIGATLVVLLFTTQAQLTVTYNLYLAALVAVWCASLFYIYIGIVRARTHFAALYEERGSSVWKIPGGKRGVWFVALFGTSWNTLAIYYVFAKPWVDGISLVSWRLWLGTTSLAMIAMGTLLFWFGRKALQRPIIEER